MGLEGARRLKRLASGKRRLSAAGDCPFRFTFLYTFQKPFRHRKGTVGLGCWCMCLSHRDFGVPGLSFGRLIPPPAVLCVCVTGWVARFARSSNPLLVRSRPRFRSHKTAGADRPWHPVLVRIRSLGCPATGQGSRSAKMFLFCTCLCFPPSGSGPADRTRPIPHARSFPAGTPPCVRACGRVIPPRPRTGHLIFFPTFRCCTKSNSSTVV